MLSEDQYMERTPDLVAKIRKLRETAEKEMNRFTRLADYDVRRVIGHGPKPAPKEAIQSNIDFETPPADGGNAGEKP
jgi:hypothetical protein